MTRDGRKPGTDKKAAKKVKADVKVGAALRSLAGTLRPRFLWCAFPRGDTRRIVWYLFVRLDGTGS